MPIKHYKRQVRKNPIYDGPKAHWSDKQRLEAVTLYLVVGQMTTVAATLKIPVDTLRHWKMQPWWKEYEADIRRANNLQVSGKLQNLINKSADLVLDRLENGDFIFDTATGKIKRRPLSAKVGADILTKTIDKEILLQKLEVKEEVQEEAIMDRLKSIQDILRANGRKQLPVIDVPYSHVEGTPIVEGVLTVSPSDGTIINAELSTRESIQEEASADTSAGGTEQS